MRFHGQKCAINKITKIVQFENAFEKKFIWKHEGKKKSRFQNVRKYMQFFKRIILEVEPQFFQITIFIN
jgi:hypothetical protein